MDEGPLLQAQASSAQTTSNSDGAKLVRLLCLISAPWLDSGMR